MAGEAVDPSAPNLVEVFSSQGHLGARVAKSKLEAAGIPVMLSYDSASLLFGITVDGIGEVRVLVPESFAEEARGLLSEDQPPQENASTDTSEE